MLRSSAVSHLAQTRAPYTDMHSTGWELMSNFEKTPRAINGFNLQLSKLTRVCLEFNLRLKDFICLAYREVVQESIILFVVLLM